MGINAREYFAWAGVVGLYVIIYLYVPHGALGLAMKWILQ